MPTKHPGFDRRNDASMYNPTQRRKTSMLGYRAPKTLTTPVTKTIDDLTKQRV